MPVESKGNTVRIGNSSRCCESICGCTVRSILTRIGDECKHESILTRIGDECKHESIDQKIDDRRIHINWLLIANHCSENPGRDWDGKVSEVRTSQKTCQ